MAHELAHEFVFSESRCKKPLLIKGLIIIIGGAGEMMFASHELEKRGIGSHQRSVIRNSFKDGFF